MSNQPAARETVVEGQSTSTFGRVLCSARTHHFVADGPVSSGCPGEALGPGELFLAGVASCGVELVQVLARNANIPLTAVSTTIHGSSAGARDSIRDVALFSSVRLDFTLRGVSLAQGQQLIDSFKRR